MFDLIILGGGPGGYDLAEKAAKAGFKTAVIEKNKLGGTCVNVGCIPSKAFLHAEKIIFESNHSQNLGIDNKKVKINQKQLVKFKDQKVDFLVRAVEMKLKKLGVKIFKSKGTIAKNSKAGAIEINLENKETIKGEKLIIATGSKIFIPPIPGLETGIKDGYVITSDHALSLEQIPKKLLILGAGVIGLELGSYFAGVGSEVMMVELGNKIAGATETEISNSLQAYLEKSKNISFKLKHGIEKIEKNLAFVRNQEGKIEKIKFDKLLVAAGRRPLIENIGLEHLQIYTKNGAIVTNEKMETNVPGVYAIGDVNGKSMLAHTAYREGEVVLDNLQNKNTKINYYAIPSVIYTSAEVAEIGINPEIAKKEGIEVEVKKISMLYSGRFVLENPEFEGFMKLTLDKKSKEIIGLSIFGNYASEIIIAGSLIIGRRLTSENLKNITFAHPTVGEIIKNALF